MGLRGLSHGPGGLHWYGVAVESMTYDKLALAVWEAIDGDSLGDVERAIMKRRVFG